MENPENMNTNTNELFDHDEYANENELLEKSGRISRLELENVALKKKLESTNSLLEQVQSKMMMLDEEQHNKKSNNKQKRVLKTKEAYSYFQEHKNDQEIRKKARQLMLDDENFVHWSYIKKVTDQIMKESA